MATASSRSAALLPREHGAYVQLGIALASGLALGHGDPRAWGQALLTALLFLASEPALILSGQRGPGLLPAVKTRALRLLLAESALALVLASWVWWSASPGQWRSLFVPVALAAALSGLAFARREHTALGELTAAWALAAAAYPVAVLGGAGMREAGLLALTLAGIQSIGTTTVRAFLESLRRRGHPLPRAIPLILGLTLVCLGLVSRLPFSWVIALAMVPNTGVAAWMLAAPPAPSSMKRVGLLLTLASVSGVLPVILALR